MANATFKEKYAFERRAMEPIGQRASSLAKANERNEANEANDELVRRISYDKLQVHQLPKETRSSSVFVDVQDNC